MSITNQGGTMKYEVTARLTVDADSPQEAVEMFDAEYRDTYNVVHLHAELIVCDWSSGARVSVGTSQIGDGQRRNGVTAVEDWSPAALMAKAEPTEWQLEEITCTHCNVTMTRLALYGHECPELKASRERGARLLEALSTLDPDEGK